MLLVFAPAADEANLQQQRSLLAKGAHGLREREIDVIEVVGAQGMALRQQFSAAESRFVVVLVGKDGGEKLRRDTPLAADALFAVVDRMPMRRQERARGAGA